MAYKDCTIHNPKEKLKSLATLLLEKNLAPDIKSAELLILEGRVIVGAEKIEKPGTKIQENAKIRIIKNDAYVSRGGIKIEKAFEDFNLNASGKKAIDIGSSTGGFTDFLLQNGAECVTAIDVGYGIISWKLRKDPRVILMERTNIRNIDKSLLKYLADLTVVDISFISLKTVFNDIFSLTQSGGDMLLLVKPQFEAQKDEVEPGGVIKKRELHIKILERVLGFLTNFNITVEGVNFSKIKGAKGNKEFWLYLKKSVNGINNENIFNIEKTENNYVKIITETVDRSLTYFG
jgi:23S rRNA (cytidine1920-2'-O)/16S rRNA (cytidine1409-2'-O)-methyltransferase